METFSAATLDHEELKRDSFSQYCKGSSPVTEPVSAPYDFTEYKWMRYLDKLERANDPNADEHILEALKGLARHVRRELGLAPPMVSPAEERGLEIAWDLESVYISFEIIAGGRISWFVRFRNTNQYFADENLTLHDAMTSLKLNENLIRAATVIKQSL